MPVLKCIGGTNDGQYYEVGSLKIGEVFQIPERHIIGIVENTNQKTQAVTDEYTLRYCFDLWDGHIFSFLAPVEWTDKQAIEFQFAK